MRWRACSGGSAERHNPDSYLSCWNRSLLFISLFSSACLLAVAIRSPQYSWIRWIGLFPVFLAIQVLAPKWAFLAGMFWGLWLYISTSVWIGFEASHTLLQLLPTMLIPALYTSLSAYMRCRLGYSPFLLSVGWPLVELALKPLGWSVGLLVAGHANNHAMQALAGFFGYTMVSILIALVNAILLSVVGTVQFMFGRRLRYIDSNMYNVWFLLFNRPMPVLLRISPTRTRGPPCREIHRILLLHVSTTTERRRNVRLHWLACISQLRAQNCCSGKGRDYQDG